MYSYIGGKNRIGKWIKEFIPKETKTYVEGFSGAFWTYLNMDLDDYPYLENVVYNDFNAANANIFNCMKTPEAFYEYISQEETQTKNKEKFGEPCDPKFGEKFYEYQARVFDDNTYRFDRDIPNFKWGKEYAYVITQVFSGARPETANFIDLKHKYRCKYDSFKDRVGGIGNRYKDIPEHLRRINHVRNQDFRVVLHEYDDYDTFFYMDPPYFTLENYYSNHVFGLEDHKRLCDALKNVKGKWALSYYEFDDLEEWFPKHLYRWEKKDFHKSSASKVGNNGEELLIMNF